MSKILFVDDDYGDSDVLYRGLAGCAHQVEKVINNDHAKNMLVSTEFDIVISDIFSDEMDGSNLLDYVVEHCPGTSCIVLAKNVSVEHSVSAIKRGAFDYLARSSAPDSLIPVIEKALKKMC